MVRRTLATASLVLAYPLVAGAEDFSFKLEPGVAMPLSAPQSTIYDDGGVQSVKALLSVGPYVDVGPTVAFMVLPAAVAGMESGIAWAFGAGGRVKRPHDAVSYGGVSPWFDADLLYVRTGGLNRAGFDAAVGLSIPTDDSRKYWVGPFARYSQTGQPGREGFDNNDAKILTIGISLEVGSGAKRKTIAAESRVVDEAVAVTPAIAAACPEPSHDVAPPVYTKVVVTKDKLELKEKLYFAWDQARLDDRSFAVLDEVVQALKDHPNFRVQIEGHTSSDGGDDHNQTLSEKRATAVLDYLVSHGIAKDRLVSKGFASSVPNDTNTTAAGRENNRRVEFVVSFIILDQGGAK